MVLPAIAKCSSIETVPLSISTSNEFVLPSPFGFLPKGVERQSISAAKFVFIFL